MKLLDDSRNHRILVVDDNEAIHDDFRKILHTSSGTMTQEVDRLAGSLFGDSPAKGPALDFETSHALQGQDALQLVRKQLTADKPFALAFVDVRMPPGWNGVETVERIWEYDKDIEVVLCTAYSDYSWEEIAARLTKPDRLLILRKPFDPLEVRQLAHGLTAKWHLRRQAACRMQDLEIMVEERVQEIEELRAKLVDASTTQRTGPNV